MNQSCKHCDTPLKGKYCYHCGQHVIHIEDRRLSHIVLEFFHHFTHLDGKYLKTLRRIFLKPGSVTRDISQGITVPHFKLSALFLVGTIIYFLLPSTFTIGTSMNLDYERQTKESEFHEWKSAKAKAIMTREGITEEKLAAIYNTRQHDFGKLFTLLLIPLLIPVLWLISVMVRLLRKNHRVNAYDLGIASLEINSIILYGLFIICGLLIKLLSLFVSTEKPIIIAFSIMALGLHVIIYRFFQRAYELAWWQALLCLIIFVLGYLYLIGIYGLISFWAFI